MVVWLTWRLLGYWLVRRGHTEEQAWGSRLRMFGIAAALLLVVIAVSVTLLVTGQLDGMITLAGRLDQRGSIVYSNPSFRWTSWASDVSVSGEHNDLNPIFTSRLGQVGFQLRRNLDKKKTKTWFVRYSFSQTGLTKLLIPDLVPEDQRAALLERLDQRVRRLRARGVVLVDRDVRWQVVEGQSDGARFQVPVRLRFPLNERLRPGAVVDLQIFNPATQQYESSEFVAIVDPSGWTASMWPTARRHTPSAPV